MNLDSVIFVDNLPKLDLHGYDRDTARVMINDFISDNIKMGNECVTIIHGIGSGIIKKVTHDTLRRNKKVLDFKTYYYNQGCTIVLLSLS